MNVAWSYMPFGSALTLAEDEYPQIILLIITYPSVASDLLMSMKLTGTHHYPGCHHPDCRIGQI